MARLSLAVLAVLALWGDAWAQAPDKLLGTKSGQYQLFAPSDAVTGGLPALVADMCLKANSAGDGLEWGPCGGGGTATPLSDATPKDLGTAAAGSATAASRGDHVHNREVPAPSATEKGKCVALNSTGTAYVFAECGGGGGGGGAAPQYEVIASSDSISKRNDRISISEKNVTKYFKAMPNADCFGAWRSGDTSSWIFAALGSPDAVDNKGDGISDFAKSEGDGTHSVELARWPNTSSAFYAILRGISSGQTGWSLRVLCRLPGGGGGGSATPLSDATPKDLGTAAAGSATAASRGDHVHKRPAEIAENTAAIAAQAAEDVRLKAAIVSVENDIYRPSGNLKSGDVLTAVDCKGSPIANCMSEWKAPPSGGGGNLPAFAGAGKHLATNAANDGAEWVTPPPDLTDQVGDNSGAIEDLNFLTQDIVAGTPSTAWATVTDASNAGIALFNGAASCNAARGATYVASVSSGVAGKFPIVRVKAGFALANVRIQITGQGTATDLISGWVLLCTSSDGGFAYYHDNALDGAQAAFGTGVTAVAVQTTGGAHVGTSKYLGDPTQVERWAIVGNATGIPIAKTLPSVTGQSGKCLAVDAGAAGVEWAACGSGGASLSDATPQTDADAGDAGTATSASRADHAHGHSPQIDLLERKAAAISYPTPESFSVGVAGDPVRWKVGDVSSTLSDYMTADQIIGRQSGGSQATYTRAILITQIPEQAYKWHLQWARRSCDGILEVPFTNGQIVSGAPTGWTAYQLAVNIGGTRITCNGNLVSLFINPTLALAKANELPTWYGHVDGQPVGSTDTPKADSATGAAGTSNKWSPSDHSHPITGHDSVTWSQVAVSSLTGGGASGGVDCDGSLNHPTAQACKALTDAFRRGDYNFFAVRVARFDDNDGNEPLHTSGCVLLPGIPGAIFSGGVVAEAACTANSGKNSADSFNQYDVFAKFGNDGNYIQVRLPNYNSYGVTAVTVTVTGIR